MKLDLVPRMGTTVPHMCTGQAATDSKKGANYPVCVPVTGKSSAFVPRMCTPTNLPPGGLCGASPKVALTGESPKSRRSLQRVHGSLDALLVPMSSD